MMTHSCWVMDQINKVTIYIVVCRSFGNPEDYVQRTGATPTLQNLERVTMWRGMIDRSHLLWERQWVSWGRSDGGSGLSW